MGLIFDPLYWRRGIASRAAVLVDVAEYYAAAKTAMGSARHSIHLLNWSFESRTRLDPEDPEDIGAFLKRLADGGLDVRILCWKTALPVAATQDFFPLQDRRSFRGSKVRFVLDGDHPYGACHHQKAIIVDDAMAICGGADFGQDRWDTVEHLDDDPRRKRRPFADRCFDSRHEVMAMVEGPPAAALGELFRERWLHATGETLALCPPTAPAWPPDVEAQFADVDVAIARAAPAWRGRPEIRETQALTLASIAAAHHCIYMENQYYTSPVAAEALADRLADQDGPEVVLISTRRSPNWFDQMTMDRARVDFIRRLQRADRWGRFRIYSPSTALKRIIIVHAKLAIIDDEFVRVGSANMNNRSAGFDTECDLALMIEGEANRAAARALRLRLVAHWLGAPVEAVAEAIRREGRLGAAIESLRRQGGGRLSPIEPLRLGPLARFIAAFHLGDPTGPADSFRPRLRRQRLALEVTETAERLRSAA